MIVISAPQQASLFESVPSVEYRRLDEAVSQDQADSLEDLSLSLNDHKSAKQGQMSGNGDEQKEVPLNNKDLLQFIDEDPFSGGPGPGQDMANNNGDIAGGGAGGGAAVCGDCVSAGHTDLGPVTSHTPEQEENTENGFCHDNGEAAVEEEEKNPAPPQSETTPCQNGDSQEDTQAYPSPQPQSPVVNIVLEAGAERGAGTSEGGGVAQGEGAGLQQLSVTSLASGESFSFSADSLGTS